MTRIVSFLPAGTEIVHALGAGSDLLGRSHECDYPAEVTSLPVVSRPALRLEGMKPEEVDRAVAVRLRSGESLYEVDEVLLRELSPDVILTQDLCQVCAPSGNELSRALRELPGAPRVLRLTPRNLEQIYENILEVGGGAAGRANPRANRGGGEDPGGSPRSTGGLPGVDRADLLWRALGPGNDRACRRCGSPGQAGCRFGAGPLGTDPRGRSGDRHRGALRVPPGAGDRAGARLTEHQQRHGLCRRRERVLRAPGTPGGGGRRAARASLSSGAGRVAAREPALGRGRLTDDGFLDSPEPPCPGAGRAVLACPAGQIGRASR